MRNVSLFLFLAALWLASCSAPKQQLADSEDVVMLEDLVMDSPGVIDLTERRLYVVRSLTIAAFVCGPYSHLQTRVAMGNNTFVIANGAYGCVSVLDRMVSSQVNSRPAVRR